MPGIESLSNDQLLKLRNQSSNSSGIQSLSNDDLLSLSGKSKSSSEAQPSKNAFAQSVLEEASKNIGMGISTSAGAEKGLLDFLYGARKLSAKGIDYLTGGNLEQKVPQFTPSQQQQKYMQDDLLGLFSLYESTVDHNFD